MVLKIKCFSLIFLIFLSACLNWFLEQPSFSLQEIDLRRISFQEIDLLIGMEVRNPNNFDLKLRGMEYAIYLRGQKIGQGRLEKEVLINKSSATKISVPLQLEIRNLGEPFRYILAGQDIPYKMEGVAVIKTTIGNATIPFSKSGEVKIKR